MSSIQMGSRAPHDISGSTSIVTRRSRSFSRVRVAMMPGTEQPKPVSIGMKLLPCRPKRCMTRSMRKAARAM